MTIGTTSEDYNLRYFSHYSDTDETYDWDSPGWRAFFTGIAARTLELTGPVSRVMDVGCAKGLLVMAFLMEGCDAFGIDISAESISAAPEPVRERVRVASATEPLDGRYDLITCTEVLEHLSPEDANRAIDNICAATDRVLLSSTPGDFDEPTHVNVHPVADWVAAFATRGFFRRTDVDVTFLAPWAIYLERSPLQPRDVVHRYETYLYPLRLEVGVKRQSLLEATRQISQLEETSADSEHRAAERERVRELEHELLRLRDHAIGCEAVAGTARYERDRALEMAAVARDELDAVRASERWRVGGILLSPVAAVKRRTGR